MEDEISKFLRELTIVEIAQQAFGYEIDESKSGRTYTVLRSGGDSVRVKIGNNGFQVFASSDEDDCGTLIDFCKKRIGDTNPKLVRVRQLLRPYMPGAKMPAVRKAVTAAPRMEMTLEVDLQKVRVAVMAMPVYSASYLTEVRKLKPDVIESFNVLEGEYRCAVFVHHNADHEICGYEYKNKPKFGSDKTITGFSASGLRGLFCGRLDDTPICRIVICEAAIDALSYGQTHHIDGSLYVLTAGSNMSKDQVEQLKGLLARYPTAVLVLASDNDTAGKKMAAAVTALSESNRRIVRATPVAKDWNDDLRNQAVRRN